MHVLTIRLDVDTDEWEISTYFNKAVFNQEPFTVSVWDRIPIPSGLYDAPNSLPAVRKALAKCAQAMGIVLRPSALERIGHELALLPLGDEGLASE